MERSGRRARAPPDHGLVRKLNNFCAHIPKVLQLSILSHKLEKMNKSLMIAPLYYVRFRVTDKGMEQMPPLSSEKGRYKIIWHWKKYCDQDIVFVGIAVARKLKLTPIVSTTQNLGNNLIRGARIGLTTSALPFWTAEEAPTQCISKRTSRGLGCAIRRVMVALIQHWCEYTARSSLLEWHVCRGG